MQSAQGITHSAHCILQSKLGILLQNPTLHSRNTKFSACCMLNTAYCTVKTAHYTVHTAHCTVHTAHCTGNTAHYTVHTVQ